ncbi:hypothetical protein Pmar_PMAR016962 [Perkinsus marinus ATCC 50983]|uniref:Uncharacterized protein n=1 Tax=Perkinsus marinus (strain ATCC 50983 / TXsc) TaxID=423536 RepID=C5L4A0_PERM5|nr:hypothetical protein Pmar_PMAR016962 [Perkinsus marinus ATCC 50983]EER08442.1 hypothetical protein Pmar_PMAR016962 [Perkinsus marinus ATCC 50983]|eukprot:XP_002776626.1 hypothetical protein Pmar_PMAR016962 [Perkinsus marinus ATCC 50983]
MLLLRQQQTDHTPNAAYFGSRPRYDIGSISLLRIDFFLFIRTAEPPKVVARTSNHSSRAYHRDVLGGMSTTARRRKYLASRGFEGTLDFLPTDISVGTTTSGFNSLELAVIDGSHHPAAASSRAAVLLVFRWQWSRVKKRNVDNKDLVLHTHSNATIIIIIIT